MNIPNEQHNRRILVVDDNRAIHDDFRKILVNGDSAGATLDEMAAALFDQPAGQRDRADFQIVSAYQGEEALRLVRQSRQADQPYAMAFMDVRMPPGWDGVETTLRLWEVDPDIQVVICTAYADYSWDELLERLRASEKFVVLKKPFDSVEALQLAHALTQKWHFMQLSRTKLDELGKMVDARTEELKKTNEILQKEVEERKCSEVRLSQAEAKYRTLVEQLPSITYIAELGEHGRWHYVSPQIQSLLGFSPQEWMNDCTLWVNQIHPEDRERVLASKARSRKTGEPLDMEYRLMTGDGRALWFRDGAVVVRDELGEPRYVHGVMHDITEAKRLEEQFLHSQKVEVVGRLAGGVAHDFNNILTAIIGYCELTLRGLGQENPLHVNIEEIRKAAERAASLTRQLLAFSRKQPLQPRVLDLNGIVRDMDTMLRRLIGEDIELATTLCGTLGAVNVDSGQIEQVIINLAVNARDAMPDGGKLTIETANVTLDETYVRQRTDVVPGDYVMLAISDTGCGMSSETKAHLFEPFFTTKGVGKGTGLGLATCHGIVKQSSGHISVYSELGRGTTFKVYLPRVNRNPEVLTKPTETHACPSGSETILIAEDEPVLRALAVMTLREMGYNTLEAGDGAEALAVAQECNGNGLDLLVTDVIMPRMGGKELGDRLRASRPGLKVIYCSGYTADAIVNHGVLEPGVDFIQKPYQPSSLARKVREVLDSGRKDCMGEMCGVPELVEERLQAGSVGD